MFELLLFLFAGHFLCDFVLQSDAMILNKSRKTSNKNQRHSKWYYWLTAHSILHGAFVFATTQVLFLAILETVFHWIIDFLRGEKIIGENTDQILHLLCKFAWWLVIGFSYVTALVTLALTSKSQTF